MIRYVKCQEVGCQKAATWAAGTWKFCGEHIRRYVYKLNDEWFSGFGTVNHGGPWKENNSFIEDLCLDTTIGEDEDHAPI